MYDYLHNISKSIENQTTASELRSVQKYKNENKLLLKLEDNITDAFLQGSNIFDNNIKEHLIDYTLTEFCKIKKVETDNKMQDYVDNYTPQNERIDIEYFYIYAIKNYNKIAKKVERELTASNKQELELQKEAVRLKAVKRKQNIILFINIIMLVLKGLWFLFKISLYIMLFPFYLAIMFLAGFCGGMARGR